MTIFLTGGAGFIGSAVLCPLVAAGHDVRAPARSDASAVAVEAAGGVRSVVIAPGIVHGHGGGLPSLVKGAPQADRALLHPGDGQHWTTVHVDDLVDLDVRASDHAEAGSSSLGVNGDNPLVEDLTRSASHAPGLDGRVAAEPEDAARERLGPLLDAPVLDQQAAGAHARALGRTPRGRTLVDELAVGSYADVDG